MKAPRSLLLLLLVLVLLPRHTTLAADAAASKVEAPGDKPAARPRRARDGATLRPELVVYKTVADKPLHLQVYKPADWKVSDNRAAMIFIHGGGWTKGSTRAVQPWAEALCPRGMVVLGVEYRLSEEGANLDPGPCIEDAKSAVRHVRGHAAEFGIDPSRIAAAGNSAGGHLVAACALLPGFETEAEHAAVSCRPDALVLLEPVLDNGPEGGYQYEAPIIKADYARFSPAHHVTKGAPPTVIFGGRSDRAAKLDCLKRFNAAMQKEGNDCVLHEYDGPHGFCNEPSVLQDIQQKSVALLVRLGWPVSREAVVVASVPSRTRAPAATTAAVAAAAAAKTETINHGPSGVWIQLNHNQKLDSDLPDVSHYRGVMIGKAWSEIERSDGVFDWKQLDATLAQVADLGLYCGIGVATGPQSPEWIYDHGVPRVMTKGHVRDGPYPYYLDPNYQRYHGRMLQEFGKHVRSLPPRITDRVTCVLVMTGSTQDEAPYKGTPTPAQYALSESEWTGFRLGAFAKYNTAFQEGPGPVIPLLFNGLMPWSNGGPEGHDWVLAHLKGPWAHKATLGHFYQLNGEAERIKGFLPPVIDRAPGSREFAFTRCEMDQTWEKPIFRTNVGMNFYWTALSALHNGLGTWHLTSTAREWCHENSAWDFVEFFNKYAGQNQSANATGAFCALREGLNAADTKKFPEEKFGKADIKNRDRYIAICRAYASRSARMDSVDGVLAAQTTQRNTQKGLNDSGWQILDGNYERYLHQLDAEETSVGWWRVGGEVTASTPIYARFARGFEHASGRDAMYFDVKDTFFGGKPLAAASPVTVRVVYYDKGNGRWALQYDAVDEPRKTAFEITKTDTGTWKEKTVILTDAYFGNRGPHAADLMLVNTDAEDDIFHMLEITRPAPPSSPR